MSKKNEIIKHLQDYLLSIDRGFSFVAGPKRISVGGHQFYIDLVFYNYIIKCFVLIGLKTGDLSPNDQEQMKLYVDFYSREMMNEGDNPPVGLVLCADKSDATVKYIMTDDIKHILALRYMTYIPSEDEIKRELQIDEFQKYKEG